MTTIAIRRSGALFLSAAVLLSLLHALAAHVAVPFWPVPATLQPLSVLLVAGVAGGPLALAAFVAYLAEGAVGLPVFAHGGGLVYLAGPTGGYLVGQLLATALVGWLAPRVRPVLLAPLMLAGVLCMYVPGAAWLAGFVGWARAWQAGVLPFVPADAAKAGIAAAATLLARRT